MMDILNPPDILLKSISINEQNNGPEKEVYFYHGDHLGSANWITDYTGAPIQYIHYAPYGELIDNQVLYGYDERYKFTGKERDGETGYDMFGARFYWQAGTWLSVDPLADENPGKSPYMYCGWNPVKYIDPDGRWIAVTSNDDIGMSYKVVGGAVEVKDCNVYIVGNDYNTKNDGKPSNVEILGQTVTPYSFCNNYTEFNPRVNTVCYVHKNKEFRK